MLLQIIQFSKELLPFFIIEIVFDVNFKARNNTKQARTFWWGKPT